MNEKMIRAGLVGSLFAMAVASFVTVASARPASGAHGHGGDGVSELCDGHKGKNKEARFRKADKNGDGYLTEDEVGERRWSRISVADTDGDGRVSFEELKQAYKDGKIQHRRGKKGRGAKRS